MVCGFLVTAALIIMLVFALKTRQKIRNYGKSNILWKKVKVIDEMAPPQDVEAWVSAMLNYINLSVFIMDYQIFSFYLISSLES